MTEHNDQAEADGVASSLTQMRAEANEHQELAIRAQQSKES